MFQKRLKVTAVVLLAVAFLVCDVPWLGYQTRQTYAQAPGGRQDELCHLLGYTIDFQGVEGTDVKLTELLDNLARVHRFPYRYNEKAFADEREKSKTYKPSEFIGHFSVADPDPLPVAANTLEAVLRMVLARIPVPSRTILLVRQDHLEITTELAFRSELGMPAAKPGEVLGPLVRQGFDKEDPKTVLEKLAAASGRAVVLDRRVKNQKLITARFMNTPVDTAVGVVADMVGLEAVIVKKAFYVTTPENAAQLRKLPRARAVSLSLVAPGPLPAKMKQSPADVSAEHKLCELLRKAVSFEGVEGKKVKLSGLLDKLATAHRFKYTFNKKAFAEDLAKSTDDEGSPQIGDLSLTNSAPLLWLSASLETILRHIIARIPSRSGALVVVRKDHLEITTERAFRRELGMPAAKSGERLLPPIHEHFDRESPQTLLQKLAAASGYNVVLDPRAESKTKRITTRLMNVPVDAAVGAVAERMGLDVVRFDNVFYVTTTKNAERLRKFSARRR